METISLKTAKCASNALNAIKQASAFLQQASTIAQTSDNKELLEFASIYQQAAEELKNLYDGLDIPEDC